MKKDGKSRLGRETIEEILVIVYKKRELLDRIIKSYEVVY